MADALKAQGNAAFSAGDFQSAIDFFSQAIAIDAGNHVLFSNRSAAKASLKDYSGALEDAKECVSIKPDWGKGYSRLGAAHIGLAQWDEAIAAYEKGLTLDPSNEQLKAGLQDAKDGKSAPPSGGPGGGLFSSPDLMIKLAMDPRTRSLLNQPDFMAMFSDVQKNPSNMTKYMADPNFQTLMEVAFGLKMAANPGAAGFGDDDDIPGRKEEEADSKPAPSAPAPAKEELSAPEVEMDDGDKEKAARKAEALKEKEKGNESYKKKEFEDAILHYNKAIELDDSDISFLTNRAAVHFETKNYDACIADCDKAVEHGREVRADYKLIAKAMTRKGSALVKLDRLEEAIAIFNKSLTEHRNADTLKKLNETEKLLKERAIKAYINMDLSNEEKEKGNTAFKEMKYPEAVKHYEEALKRGPPEVNPEAHKLYSNLAACFTKLGAYPDGIKAVDKCIELAPEFSRGYSRKGTLQLLMKEYDKALETYQQGLKLDPENEEMKDGVNRCYEAISRFASGEASKEEIQERQARSMADPEVQGLLKDPVMQNVLRDFQENPKAAQVHLKNPGIMAKINKLVAAGIIQVK